MGKKDKQNAAESTPEKDTGRGSRQQTRRPRPQKLPRLQEAEKSAEPETFTVTREQMEKMEGLAKLLADEQDKYLRLAAEYDNYRKRTAKEKESIYSRREDRHDQGAAGVSTISSAALPSMATRRRPTGRALK